MRIKLPLEFSFYKEYFYVKFFENTGFRGQDHGHVLNGQKSFFFFCFF